MEASAPATHRAERQGCPTTGVINLLQGKSSQIEITAKAAEGEITEQQYEDKVQEACRQPGIHVVEKRLCLAESEWGFRYQDGRPARIQTCIECLGHVHLCDHSLPFVLSCRS